MAAQQFDPSYRKFQNFAQKTIQMTLVFKTGLVWPISVKEKPNAIEILTRSLPTILLVQHTTARAMAHHLAGRERASVHDLDEAIKPRTRQPTISRNACCGDQGHQNKVAAVTVAPLRAAA